MDLQPETIGKYEVLTRLSIGGMAELFLACLPGPGGFKKFVALKQILPDARSDEQFVTMFLDEARITAALVHPNIGQVFELGEEPELYLAMEFIPGQNLAAIRRTAERTNTRIPIAIACRIIRDVCLGLHAAHSFVSGGEARPVVHRDVSLKNVMLSYSGHVKVIDFGIAKALGRLRRTQPGVMLGTPSYMAPEQVLDHAVDARTDLFAVGIMLHELLTGARLFNGVFSGKEVLTKLPPAPSVTNPEVSAELDAIVLKAISRQPAERFQTGKELAKAIEKAQPNLPDEEDLAVFMQQLFAAQIKSTHELISVAQQKSPHVAQLSGLVQRMTAPMIEVPPRATPVPVVVPASKWSANALIIGGVALGLIGLVAFAVLMTDPPPPVEAPTPAVPIVAVKPAAKPQPVEADVLLKASRRGQAASARRDWAEAARAFDDVLAVAPNNFGALMGLGIAELELKQNDSGRKRLEQALQLSEINGATIDDRVRINVGLARSAVRRSDGPNASRYLREAIAADASVATVLAADPEFAELYKPRAPPPGKGEAQALFKEANQLKKAKNYERAAFVAERCVMLDPTYYPCFRLAGSAMATLAARDGNAAMMERAKKRYQSYVELAPPNDEYVPFVKKILAEAR